MEYSFDIKTFEMLCDKYKGVINDCSPFEYTLWMSLRMLQYEQKSYQRYKNSYRKLNEEKKRYLKIINNEEILLKTEYLITIGMNQLNKLKLNEVHQLKINHLNNNVSILSKLLNDIKSIIETDFPEKIGVDLEEVDDDDNDDY